MPRYIDADALIDFLDVGHLRHPSELCFSEFDVANLLLHAPTISPDEARGVGKWITKENGKVWWYECSCCGTRPLKSRWANEETLSCYCPSCGARMKGEQ